MKIVLRSVACLAVVCLTGGVARAADGVLIVQRTTTNGTPQTSQVQIAKDKMRADVIDPMGKKQMVIFDATREVIDIIDVDRKTYMEVTKAQIEEIAAQMQGMMAQMQGMMASMPPDQRAQMEAMMRGRGAGMGMGAMAAPAKTEYRKTGTDRVGQWACDKYEGWQNGQKVSDLCTAAPAAIGLAAADTAVMQQLAEFFKKLVPQGSGLLEVGRAEDQGFAGIPVRTVTTVSGRSITSELTEVSRQTFADSLFQVPAGLQKQEFPGMGRGRQ